MSTVVKFHVLRTQHHVADMASGEIAQVQARKELKRGTRVLKRRTALNRICQLQTKKFNFKLKQVNFKLN